MRSISKTVNDILLSCEPTCFAVLKEPIWSTANAVSVINHDSLILLYFLHHDLHLPFIFPSLYFSHSRTVQPSHSPEAAPCPGPRSGENNHSDSHIRTH